MRLCQPIGESLQTKLLKVSGALGPESGLGMSNLQDHSLGAVIPTNPRVLLTAELHEVTRRTSG
eukprot:1861366-Amphidinium_carterae.1